MNRLENHYEITDFEHLYIFFEHNPLIYLYVDMSIRWYVYTLIYLYLDLSIRWYIYTLIYLYVDISIRWYVYTLICVYVAISIRWYIYTLIYLYVDISMRWYVYALIYLYVDMSIRWYVYTLIYLYVDMSIRWYVYTLICLYVELCTVWMCIFSWRIYWCWQQIQRTVLLAESGVRIITSLLDLRLSERSVAFQKDNFLWIKNNKRNQVCFFFVFIFQNIKHVNEVGT